MSFIDVLTAFSIIFGAFFLYSQAILKNKADTVNLIDTLVQYNWFEFYRLRLKSALDTLDTYLGKPTFSWYSIGKNLSFHYLLALSYVFVTFFIIWFLGGDNSIGTIEVLPQKESYLERFTTLVGIVFMTVLSYFLFSEEFKNIDKNFKEKFKNLLPKSLQHSSQLIEKILIFLFIFASLYYFQGFIFAIIFSLISITWRINSLLFTIGILGGLGLAGLVELGVTAIVTAGIVGGVAEVVVAGAVTVEIGVVVGVVAGVIAVGGVVIMGGISSLINTSYFWNLYNTSILIFLLITPFLNGILDFISLSISRYFSQKILNENLFLILFHLVLDFIFALIFLFVLMALLYYSIDFFNTFIDEKLQIPIDKMIYATLQNPFSLDNLWITFMLLSTLIPTLLHIILALASLLLYITKTTDWLIHQIEEGQKSEAKQMKATAFLAFLFTILALVIFYLLVYIPVSWILPTTS